MASIERLPIFFHSGGASTLPCRTHWERRTGTSLVSKMPQDPPKVLPFHQARSQSPIRAHLVSSSTFGNLPRCGNVECSLQTKAGHEQLLVFQNVLTFPLHSSFATTCVRRPNALLLTHVQFRIRCAASLVVHATEEPRQPLRSWSPFCRLFCQLQLIEPSESQVPLIDLDGSQILRIRLPLLRRH